MYRIYKIYNQEVVEELKNDSDLSLIFYARFSPYDPDVDPTHNPHWVERAKREEKFYLEEAKLALKQAKDWLRELQKQSDKKE